MQRRLGTPQTFETLRLMRENGIPANVASYPDPPRPLSFDGVVSGNFMGGASSFSFWLTPRSPDGYPRLPGLGTPLEATFVGGRRYW